jgi:hypothetical protein
MVFAWGTNYRLSLYNAGHQDLPAKVCTRGSEAAKNAVDHAADGNTVAHAFVSVTVLYTPFQGTRDYPQDRLRDDAIIDRSPLSRAPILYLRPPLDKGPALD